MLKRLAVTFGVAMFASVAMAQVNMTLDVRACGEAGGNSVNVPPDPSCEFTYAVVGELSAAPNQGLATIGFPLVFSGGPLARGVAPTGLPMSAFAIPDGLNNPVDGQLVPEGFGGTPIRGVLQQCGGAENTLGNEAGPGIDYLIGTPMLNVAQNGSPEVLMTGTIGVPAGAANGQVYTLAITATCVDAADPASSSDAPCASDGDCSGGEVCKGHPFAMVIKAVQTPGIAHLEVEPVGTFATTPLTINVVTGAACPCAATPPQVLKWESMATHGTVGEVGLLIPEDGSFVEPRSTGINKLVVTFDGDVNASAAVAAAEGCTVDGTLLDLSGVAIGVAEGAGGNTVEITFTPKLPGSGLSPGTHTPAAFRVTLDGVAGDIGTRAQTERTFKVVLGDAFIVPSTGLSDARVTAADNGVVRSLAAAGTDPIDPGNVQHVRADAFVDGKINAADNGLVRSLAAEGLDGQAASLTCIP